MLSKEHILTALGVWIRQRPGLEFGNYGAIAPYRAELRQITKDKRDAETLLTAVALRPSITAANLLDACKGAFSGRLSITEDKGRARIEYCTGQYWPTEYRKAAAAVLASALWARKRKDMPKPTHSTMTNSDVYDGLSAGDWIMRSFKREFGRSIQNRWFS